PDRARRSYSERMVAAPHGGFSGFHLRAGLHHFHSGLSFHLRVFSFLGEPHGDALLPQTQHSLSLSSDDVGALLREPHRLLNLLLVRSLSALVRGALWTRTRAHRCPS